MDPLSQGVVGASLPQGLFKNSPYVRIGFFIAFLSGMAPDLDILIRSDQDPLLALEYHRQFTHSLIFIPFGGLICSLLSHCFTKNRIPFRWNYIFATLGFATHGLLDACTTYGTQLFWPFSNTRVAWNNVSIIDPIFTIPILILIIGGAFFKKPRWSQAALLFGISYLCFGVLQRERAKSIGHEVATQRGHKPIRLEAKPSFGNLILWKVVYEYDERFYVDAVRVGFKQSIFEGSSIDKLNVKRDFPEVSEQSTQKKDIERFRWFSNDYLAKDPTRDNYIMDVRYSFLPQKIGGMFRIQLTQNQQEHVLFSPFRKLQSDTSQKFLEMLLGRKQKSPAP